jgi:hypothetical protein
MTHIPIILLRRSTRTTVVEGQAHGVATAAMLRPIDHKPTMTELRAEAAAMPRAKNLADKKDTHAH